MRYMVGLMIVVFAGCGLMLIALFTRELVQRFAARRRFLRAEGEVVHIVRKNAPRSSGEVRLRPSYLYFPVVTFTTAGGSPVKFQSEMGDSGRDESESRYRVGQRLAVRYDPEGKIPPTLDTWSGMWGPPVIGIFAGLVFLAGSAMTAWAFGNRMLGR